MSSKPGRNDPCHCGSGKKYKNCHMAVERQSVRDRLALQTAIPWLRQEIISFAQDERFAAAFARAIGLYWNDFYTLATADQMSEDEALRFYDWFFYDYIHHDEDDADDPDNEYPRLVEVFRNESYDELATRQKEVFDGWFDAPPAGGYELLGVDGQTFHLRDFLTGDSYEIYKAEGRGNLSDGDIILARVQPMGDRWQFSTTAAYLPQAEINDLPHKMQAAREQYNVSFPDGDHADFMRRHNYLLVHHALEQAEKNGRPPVTRLRPDNLARR